MAGVRLGPSTSRGDGTLRRVIRLEAATVLLQWAVGGLAFCWFTTRRREVGLGYGWLLRGIYLLMAVGSVMPRLAIGVGPIRGAASPSAARACLPGVVPSSSRRRSVGFVARPVHPPSA